MSGSSWFRARKSSLSASASFLYRTTTTAQYHAVNTTTSNSNSNRHFNYFYNHHAPADSMAGVGGMGGVRDCCFRSCFSNRRSTLAEATVRFCTVANDDVDEENNLESGDIVNDEFENDLETTLAEATVGGFFTVASDDDDGNNLESCNIGDDKSGNALKTRATSPQQSVDFTKVDIQQLPTVILVGRPNVGKSALFNRLIRRREALVYNTPDDHVTRDIREGIAKLGDLRFRVLDSAGLEMAATSGSILDRTADLTANVLAKTQLAIFLIDVRHGLHPMDVEVANWMRKHARGVKTILVMNKCESLDDGAGYLLSISGEAHILGMGDAIAISAETGMGMVELYESVRPILEDYMQQVVNVSTTIPESDDNHSSIEDDESKLPLQLAIVGRPNVGKSTLLNTLLQEERVVTGPEAGLTRDSIRAQFQYEGRTINLVDTAGWLQRTKQEKGAASLSVMQSKKSIMRAHIVAIVLNAEEIADARSSMKHAENVIARQAIEEGRGLVVIVNKIDLLRGTPKLLERVMKAVPQEIQSNIPQVTGVPVLFISALEGEGRLEVMRQVIYTYEKWCLRLSTARLNRWLRKVLSRHSWKHQAAQPKIKYFTQVKARPPTFVAFLSGKVQLSDTDIRFLTRSLKEDFDIAGIPIRIMQRFMTRNHSDTSKSTSAKKKNHSAGKQKVKRTVSDKKSVL